MGFLTNEFRNAYKVGRSTIDVLYILNNNVKNDGAGNLVLFDLTKAPGAFNRDIMWTGLYERGIHATLLKLSKWGIKTHA